MTKQEKDKERSRKEFEGKMEYLINNEDPRDKTWRLEKEARERFLRKHNKIQEPAPPKPPPSDDPSDDETVF